MGSESRREKSAREVLKTHAQKGLIDFMFTHQRAGAIIVYGSLPVYVCVWIAIGVWRGLKLWNEDRHTFHEVCGDLARAAD